MKIKSVIVLSVLLGGLIFGVGCGTKKPAGFPNLVPCNVSVTKGGKPIDKTVLTLVPVSNGGEWISSGLTNSGGIAEISTILSSYSSKGVPEGEFKVFLSRPIEIDLKVSQEDVINMSVAEHEKLKKETDRLTEEARVIPEKLESIVTTPAKITVTEGKTSYKIELNDY
ncbi:MAG: hypothetical protein LBG58_01295 [Planctomycetaceae bacterium]|nr:hypothetical protein [Planctomycetaceae bacterium]